MLNNAEDKYHSPKTRYYAPVQCTKLRLQTYRHYATLQLTIILLLFRVPTYENLSLMEEANDSQLDVFQKELKLLPKSARVS